LNRPTKPIILGIEGTAWNLSAAIVDTFDVIAEVTSTYVPPTGGIHPREASQHHADHIKNVISTVLANARDKEIAPGDINAIAFSQGPGLGPCLRTAATAARALSLSLNIPLIGVNHCVVSGANSQVLAYRAGRYRVFGETLDIGIGNALDKFARGAGLQHPGGPKIEELAKNASSYVPLPYVVKGMDFSFTGLSTAASAALKKSPIEDVCFSFQETAFAMLVEVTERAVAHTGKHEILLAGGVGANMRLREMLGIMCNERGISFYVPEQRFMGDNGSMIAYLGLLMFEQQTLLPLNESHVRPNYRPDDVVVTWRGD